jgi:hypothetical protein
MASQGPIRPEFRYCFDAGEVIGAIEGAPLREPLMRFGRGVGSRDRVVYVWIFG